MSTKTGVAPTAEMASAVAINVCATVITSSPGPMSRAQGQLQRRYRWQRRHSAALRRNLQGRLKFAHFRPHDKAGVLDDTAHGGIYVILNHGVLRLEIDQRDRLAHSSGFTFVHAKNGGKGSFCSNKHEIG
ncbi:MAG: hypothetical protein R2873_31575 [Caldilineaceae bacterium]